ncbi:uncharacterized protein LOC121871005 [Homarus americanus]|uniref:acylglycerol lipase n=1 Tax=Homarus americanus TaxID=6706 RepID=A0A8J5MVJ9_HOMAM|nr:uncharacterized protein LOC121871005 [Homarus americanus]KAG7164992.1 ABHD8-like [Homarus americanus]
MDNVHLHLLSVRDEIVENWYMVRDFVASFLPKKNNTIGVASGDLGQDSDGRVWVEVGGPGLRLRVMHLHPANPSVAEALVTHFSAAAEDGQGGNIVQLPADDEISLASLEDYWFNHWQGPYVSADSNQNTVNFRRSRRSLRKSKRKFRCSVCHKKIVGPMGHHNELQEVPCFDGENVLAHVPSVKLETISPKLEETAAGSSDDECIKPAISEELLSRYSASDEQLARAYRVMDNELRTSFTLFAEEVVTQDVVDGVSMNINDSRNSPDASMRLAPPLLSPRQSRSCPCSPKLSGRNHSPKSNTGSPKPQSRSGSSKFSLSSSLMAIHRQASNSLRPDFLRFDSGKGDFGGSCSKNGSQQNSLRNESRYSRPSLEAQHSSFGESHLDSSNSGSLRGESTRHESSRIALHESQSLPTLKLSKMSMTYKGGVLVNQDKDPAQLHFSDTSKLLVEGACALPSTPEDDTISEELSSPTMLLPDVVPRYEVGGSPLNRICESEPSVSSTHSTPMEPSISYHYDSKEGIINLGFDGHDESSDFTDLNEAISAKASDIESNSQRSRRGSTDSDIDIGKHNLQMNVGSVHAISIGHVPQGQDVALSLELPQVLAQETSQAGADISNISDMSETPSSSRPTTPSTASPSLAPHNPSSGDTNSTSPQRPIIEEGDDDDAPYDHMQEARQLVFWWQKSNPHDDSEFCQNNAECKVKQKPLLLFLHGMGGSSDHWRQQLWYFVSCGYEVVAPDLMGHGLSSAPKDASQYTFSQMLDHITLVFDLFVPQGRKCVVIGHGYGCSLAAALARGRALSVRLVIMASCGGPNPLIPNPPSKSILHSHLATFLSPFLACGCCSREILYAPRGKHFASATLSGSDITPTPRYVLEYVAKGQNWPEGDVAFHRRITVPTLLLQGMKDDRVSLVEMCEMERTIPRAFLEMVPGGGHDLMTDAPLEVCHAIHRFIKRWKQQL